MFITPLQPGAHFRQCSHRVFRCLRSINAASFTLPPPPSFLSCTPPPLPSMWSRCDVISTEADGNDIVFRWRLSGRVNLPFKPPIKPYVVTTTFERDAGERSRANSLLSHRGYKFTSARFFAAIVASKRTTRCFREPSPS